VALEWSVAREVFAITATQGEVEQSRGGGPTAGQGVRLRRLAIAVLPSAPQISAKCVAGGAGVQDPDDQLFSPTVREDVAFGPLNLGLDRDEVLRRVRESLTPWEWMGPSSEYRII